MNMLQTNKELYEKNLLLLRQRDIDLAVRLESQSLPENVTCEYSKDGNITLVYVENGIKKYLHSKFSPIQEAERFVNGQDLKKRLEVDIFGVGMGYHVDFLIERDFASINIIEPKAALFKLVMHLRDISSWILDDRITFFVGVSPVYALNILAKKNQARILWRPVFVVYNPVCDLFPEKCKEFLRVFEEDIKHSRTMAATLLVVSLDTLKNSLINLPFLVKYPGVEGWIASYRDKPIFCVSPGPSLKNAIGVLKKVKGKAPIVAVDTAMKPLLKAGVKPDFILGIDFTPQNKKHYEGISEEDMKDIVLIADIDMYYEIFPMWKGPMFVTYYKHSMSKFFNFKSNMVKGPTTAHIAFLFSFFLGAEPIILIGQDLSYPDVEEAYMPGVSYQRKISIIKDKQGNELLLKINKDDPNKKALTFVERVESVDGGVVVTEPVFLSFGMIFERMIDVLKVNVIDAKLKGMKIKGTINMSPEQVYKEYCKSLESINVLEKAEQLREFYISDINVKAIKDEVERIKKNYYRFYKDSKKVFRKIEKIYKKGKEKGIWPEKDLKKVNELIENIFEKYEIEVKFSQLIAGMVSFTVKKYLTFSEKISDKDRFEAILAFWEAIIKAGGDIHQLYKEIDKVYKENL